ncbi:hypothetical protein KHQ82_00015 [Mycoplasmatota bacterium]|nr:hypothetical protein KHQ82_00015 [Mycoplasmatota bacterium]
MKNIKHYFVEYIPPFDSIDENTVYTSLEFNVSVHRCACGCGRKVTLPIAPDEWQIFYDGETVSLYPSIGNWDYPCRSHYFITDNMFVFEEQLIEERCEQELDINKKEKKKKRKRKESVKNGFLNKCVYV